MLVSSYCLTTSRAETGTRDLLLNNWVITFSVQNSVVHLGGVHWYPNPVYIAQPCHVITPETLRLL